MEPQHEAPMPQKRARKPVQDPNIVESGEEDNKVESPHKTSGKTCIAPGCTRDGSETLNGLCDDCYSVLLLSKNKEALEKAKAKPKPTAAQLTFPETAEQCKVQGCDYVATPEQLGYCSACYKKQQEGGLRDDGIEQRLPSFVYKM